ncbi:hypothetical protein [Roseospira goensis]|uniref:Uncharacterized protein n=1 Tax=Roseospira goensis TaxID=391922 RepID=A0A7W6WM06_9PROT|nr:hypothetical protein [Roseospira goensis]MBB4287610.1 hypothetical protein [Roseospira goensis]
MANGLLAAFGGALTGLGTGLVARGEDLRQQRIAEAKMAYEERRALRDRAWSVEDRDLGYRQKTAEREDRQRHEAGLLDRRFGHDREMEEVRHGNALARTAAGRSRYRPLSPEEVEQHGFDPRQSYQVDDVTGKVSPIGSPREAGMPLSLNQMVAEARRRAKANGTGHGEPSNEEVEAALREMPGGSVAADKLFGVPEPPPEVPAPPPVSAPRAGASVSMDVPAGVTRPEGTDGGGGISLSAERAPPAHGELPAGVTAEQALQQAQRAIAAGADPAAVRARLRQYGLTLPGAP